MKLAGSLRWSRKDTPTSPRVASITPWSKAKKFWAIVEVPGSTASKLATNTVGVHAVEEFRICKNTRITCDVPKFCWK